VRYHTGITLWRLTEYGLGLPETLTKSYAAEGGMSWYDTALQWMEG
jgi:hypothetical protein